MKLLSKDRIRLRATEPEDVDFLVNMENDSDLWQVSNTHNPFSRFDIEQYVLLSDKDLYSAGQLRFMIDLEEDNNYQTIGTVDIFEFDAHNRRAGIGLSIIENKRNKGYAGGVLDILTNYMFNHVCVHQIYCNIGADNKVSIQLFESKGFIKSGVKSDWNLVNNQMHDEIIYQLINPNDII
jgi:diamine N-acetyltransferase